MNAGLAKHAAESLLPLSARDFLGKAGDQSAAVGPLMPLDAPQTRTATGTFRQALGAATLNPLNPADHIPGVKPNPTAGLSEHDKITAQAQKWVAQTFYGTLLKQMHESPFKSELFSGGRAGEAFQPLMDQHLIDHMARSSGKKLVRGIVRQIEGREAYKRQQAAKAKQTGSPAAVSPYDAVNGAKKPSAEGEGQPSQDEPRNPSKQGRSRVAIGLRA